MIASGTMIHKGLSVHLGSLALHIIVLRASWFFDFTVTKVLTPNRMLSLSGVMRTAEKCLRLSLVLCCTLARSWLSESVSELVGGSILYVYLSCGVKLMVSSGRLT